MTWKAFAEQDIAFNGPVLRVARLNDGKAEHVINLTFQSVPEYGVAPLEPMMHGHEVTQFLQAMMDAAYEFGLRPSCAQDERFMKAHLEDMREIVRHTLKMNKPT